MITDENDIFFLFRNSIDISRINKLQKHNDSNGVLTFEHYKMTNISKLLHTAWNSHKY